MFPYSDPTIVAARQQELRLDAERERLAATARRDERSANGWITKRFGGFVVGRLGRLVAAAR
jgi:hypothetical protein